MNSAGQKSGFCTCHNRAFNADVSFLFVSRNFVFFVGAKKFAEENVLLIYLATLFCGKPQTLLALVCSVNVVEQEEAALFVTVFVQSLPKTSGPKLLQSFLKTRNLFNEKRKS